MCEECPPEVLSLAYRLSVYVAAHDHVIAGGLHIVIEDENVQTHHIKWCQETQYLDAESAGFARELLAMPVPYRHMVIQLAWDNRPPWEWDDEEGEAARAAMASIELLWPTMGIRS